jgi:hypothetical protein
VGAAGAADEAFSSRKRRVVEEKGDGSCLFRAVARQVKVSPERHEDVRREVVSFSFHFGRPRHNF